MINNLLETISQFALDVIDSSGYLGIFVLSAVESAAIPIPSEVVLPFSGFLASAGRFNFWIVVLVATAANLAGSLVLYYISALGGRRLLERYGKYILITEREMEIGDKWFSKYGVKTIFWGRLLPVVRTFISLPAGLAKMNVGKFILYTTAGAFPWNLGLAYIGYVAGENWNLLHGIFRRFNYAIVGLIILGIIWFVWKHQKKS